MAKRKSKKRSFLQFILWITTAGWFFFCLYLSWQTGEETGRFSQRIAQFLLDQLGRLGIKPDPQQFHAGLRLFAHFGVFFVTGFLAAGALYVTLPRDKGWTAFWIAAVSCILIAVLAEVGKLAVPGRHLTWSETDLNVLGALAGAAAARAIWRLIRNYDGKRPRKFD